jgi:sporulation protein YlmC with PRC-barrel domain
MLWASPMAFAAEKSGAAADTAAKPGEAKSAAPSHQYRATSLMELRVTNAKKEELGTISELLIDKQGRVSHVVLQEGGLLGMGENRYVVPWNRIRIGAGDNVAVLDVAKDRLASEFSAFEPEEQGDAGEPSR